MLEQTKHVYIIVGAYNSQGTYMKGIIVLVIHHAVVALQN